MRRTFRLWRGPAGKAAPKLKQNSVITWFREEGLGCLCTAVVVLVELSISTWKCAQICQRIMPSSSGWVEHVFI